MSTDRTDKKHPCPDCQFCQWCGDDRCNLCRNTKGCGHRKLSMREQIELYEKLNQEKKSSAE